MSWLYKINSLKSIFLDLRIISGEVWLLTNTLLFTNYDAIAVSFDFIVNLFNISSFSGLKGFFSFFTKDNFFGGNPFVAQNGSFSFKKNLWLTEFLIL